MVGRLVPLAIAAAALLAGCGREAASPSPQAVPPAATAPGVAPGALPPPGGPPVATSPEGIPPTASPPVVPPAATSPEGVPPTAAGPREPVPPVALGRNERRPGTTANPGDLEGARLLAERRLFVPVQGVGPEDLTDTYHASRGDGRHEAIDIVAPAGTPVVAVDDGTIAKLFTSRAGGLTVYQFDPQGRLAYYYAHLDAYAPGLREGQAVKRGQTLGSVGSTGNADPRTPHLHFGVFVLGPQKRWWEGEPVNPYPALRGAERATQQEETLAMR